MRASTFTTLIAALGFSAAGSVAALAEQYRGPLESIDTNRNSIRVMGITILGNGHPLGKLDMSSDYVVDWQKKGSDNVLTSIEPVPSKK